LRKEIYAFIGLAIISAFLGVEMWLLIIGIIVVGGLLIALLSQFTEQEPYKEWYGAMFCNSCHYSWQSRRDTPPAKCPNCSSKNIEPTQVTKYRTIWKK
jgi:DNA-directed RNA polymerase subunit RPC12/RpoP